MTNTPAEDLAEVPEDRETIDLIAGRIRMLAREFFSLVPPERLAHYTSLRGLISMREQGALWATDSRFLNDRSEGLELADFLPAALDKTLESAEFEYPETAGVLRRWATEALQTANTYVFYVFCLTESWDVLSQWSTYAGGGTGVCLVLQTGSLLQHLQYPVMVRCVYPAVEKAQRVELFLKFMGTQIDLDMRPLGKPRYRTKQQFGALMAVLRASFKNQRFEAEREWRCIFHNAVGPAPDLQFRVRNSMLVPYLQLPLSRGLSPMWRTDGTTRVPADWSMLAERCIVGPSPHPVLNEEAVRQMFPWPPANAMHAGMSRISTSTIPFVDW